MLRRIRRIQPVLADKVALVLVTILVAGILVSWGLVVTAAGVNGASHVLASTGVSWIENGLIGIGLIWIVLRAIDFARGGPTRALLSMPGIHAHTLHAPSAGKDLAHHC